MFSFFKTKYTEDEKQYFDYIKKVVSLSGVASKEVESTARQILDEAIKKADKAGLRGVKTIGNNAIKDEKFLNKRLQAGLTKDDVLKFLNRDYVWIVAENMLTETHRLSMFMALTMGGESDEEAEKKLRKTFIYCDDPEKSHPNYRGEDADIYPEFASRHENWRSRISPTEVQNLANQYSTYNAMVRDLIRKGVI
ncbi:hypothetical protein [Candidatus Nitrotoga sp. 1052]|uniref:hypothetical protein n=1 Tax=Candidatus Nitrotoga sp. 1052 TaxID=2886964 RepID=UPI001EF542AE|nr:hypothetical protein [Candidatus Nitrotoga sp. 1052]CAH1077741.1 hypothetical protein NTG1052_300090 [Candidatus Nitrotoga sp. 1052]